MNELLCNNHLFTLPILCGGIFLVTGFVLLQFPPKKINSLYGYRTARSMRSQEAWDFAQKFSAKLLMKYGVALMIVSLLSFFTDFSNDTNLIIGFVFLFAVVILLFFQVEKELKTFFSQ